MKMNHHYGELKASYLFVDIAHKVAAYQEAHPEKEIIRLVANGYSNKEIAAEMYLGEGTVRNYLSSILDKLQLRDRTQVAVFYYKHR